MLPVADIAAGIGAFHIAGGVPFHHIPVIGIIDKALDMKPYALFALVRYGGGAFPAGSGVQPSPGKGKIPQRGGQADSAGIYAGKGLQAFQDAQKLQAAHIPHKIVYFIDNHIAQVRKHGQTGAPLIGEQAFQGFGGNLQEAFRILYQFIFLRDGGVPMPFCDPDIGL